jgi:iron complex outermembrane receptor protein
MDSKTFSPSAKSRTAASRNESTAGRDARRAITRMLAVTTALGLGLGIAMPAFAQEAAPAARASADNGTPDIIVTARRIQERLQDVPISITVYNQQQIANKNIVNAQDLAAYTPSLSSNNNFGSENTAFAIRGFVQDTGTQPSVGVYFADVVAPRGASNNIPIGDGAGPGAFFDLQNVQVLKGPQGTLFGRNTTGGAILLVPQKPTNKLEGYVEGSYGNYDMKRIQGVLNVPLSDIARFRIGVDHLSRDGISKNDSPVGPKTFDDVDYTAIRASLVVDLTPNLENYTIASYTHSSTNGTAAKLVGCNPASFLGGVFACPEIAAEAAKGAGFYTVQNTLGNTYTHLDTWQIINTTTWHASDSITLKNIASYAQLKENTLNTLFGVAFDSANANGILPPAFRFIPSVPIDFALTNPAPGADTANQSTFTEELQLQGNSLGGKLTWQAGGYLEVSDPLGLTGSMSPLFLNCSPANIDKLNCTDVTAPFINLGAVNYTVGNEWFRNVGAYAQGTYAITDNLKLTGGIRYTWDHVRADGRLITYKFPQPGVAVGACSLALDSTPYPACAVDYKEKSNAPTWLIDLDYKPSGDILLYAKYARGYRAGGITPQTPAKYATFRPEKVDSYEGGIKTEFHGALHGTFNVAGFYNNFSNQQLQLSLLANNAIPGNSVTPASGIINAGKSRIWGAEVETSITPFHGFQIDGSYSYLNAKIVSISEATNEPTDVYVAAVPLKKGDPLAQTPHNKFSITGTYTLPLDESIGRISVSANLTHTDKQVSCYSCALYPTVPSIYALRYLQATNLVNLNLNWNGVFGSRFDLAFFATNVTGKKYYAYIPDLPGDPNSASALGFATAQLGQPRMYGARLRYSFGK